MRSPERETAAVTVPAGETLSVLERVIVSPATGVFCRLDGHRQLRGAVINRGDVIGTLQSLRVSTPIRSPFAGLLEGLLVSEGQRVRQGQPVAWMTIT